MSCALHRVIPSSSAFGGAADRSPGPAPAPAGTAARAGTTHAPLTATPLAPAAESASFSPPAARATRGGSVTPERKRPSESAPTSARSATEPTPCSTSRAAKREACGRRRATISTPWLSPPGAASKRSSRPSASRSLSSRCSAWASVGCVRG